MNNKISSFLSKFNLLAGLCVLMLAIPNTAGAQATTGSVRGTVVTPSGGPAAGATVTVTDTRTSTTRSSTFAALPWVARSKSVSLQASTKSR